MKRMLNALAQYCIVIVCPFIVALVFLGFAGYYYGVGLFVISVALLTLPVCWIGGWILNSQLRKRNKKWTSRIIFTSSFAFVIGLGMQIFQFVASSPNEIKKGFLPVELEETFTATRGRIYFIAFEQEIYVELPSDYGRVQELLASRDFKPWDDIEDGVYMSGPDWFPAKTDTNYVI